MRRAHSFICSFVGVLALAACGGGNDATPAAVTPAARPTAAPSASVASADAGPAREAPPPSSASKPSPFPAVTRSELSNGARVAVIEAHGLPIVQLRVRIEAAVGDEISLGRPRGSVEIAAAMLKEGGTRTMTSGEVLRRIESMGANLGVASDFDATELSLAVTKDHLNDAMALLAEVVTAPRFDSVELGRLKSRRSDEAEDRARSDGSYAALHEVLRATYPDASRYAHYGLLPSEIAAVDAKAIRAVYEALFTPARTEIVVAGDVDAASARALVDKAFGAWKHAEIGMGSIGTQGPAEVARTRVIVADRPKSAQSNVIVALPAPERKTPDWPALRVASQTLGGGVASRIFADVREKRSLAYSTRSSFFETSSGPELVLVSAGTQTPKTADAIDGLLQNVQKIAKGDIDQAETESARRYLADVFAVRQETIGSVADLLIEQENLGLDDGYWDSYRAALRTIDPAQANAAAKKLFGTAAPLIVVSGDADVIAPALTRFGEVTVVDPEHEFQRVRTLPASH